MIFNRNVIFAFTLALTSVGCASLSSVSLTQVPKDRSHRIESTVTNWAFLGIHFTNDFVDEAIAELQQKCPNGKISGVYTKYEHYLYFLMEKRQLTASGYCESKPQVESYEK